MRTQEIAPFLQKLVRIPTVNPPDTEAKCAKPVSEKLSELGLQVNLYEAEKDRTNVVGVLKGTGGGKNFLLYSGHLDVVAPGRLDKWEFDPFEGKIKDGKIYGRGTADHKGTIAASLFALQAIIESGIKLKGDVIFLAPADEEEGGGKGADFLVKNGYIYGDAGLSAVPYGREAVGVASMGYLKVKITVLGKEVHGAFYQQGINAIDKAADLIKALRSLTFTKKVDVMPTKDSTGYLNVTMFHSGVKMTIIPGKADVFVDRRLVPGETPEEALAQLEDVMRTLESNDSEFRADIEVLDSSMGTLISEGEPVVKALRDNIQNILGFTPKNTGLRGSGDIRYLVNDAKIPMVSWCPGGFGPDGEFLHHAYNEFILIEDLIDFAKVAAATIMDICGYEIVTVHRFRGSGFKG